MSNTIRAYRLACLFACRYVAVAVAAVLLCVVMPSCSGDRKYGDERTPAHQAALRRLDDSMFVKSDNIMQAMRRGMQHAADSLDYYDYYLRYLRYSVSLNVPDTLKLD